MAQNDNNSPNPPIDYPSIVIGDTLYYAKFNLGAMYRLESMGLNTSQWSDAVMAEITAGRNIQLTCKLAAACLGTPLRDGRWKPFPFKPEELGDMIADEELPRLRELIKETMEKVQRAATAPEPAQTETGAETAAA